MLEMLIILAGGVLGMAGLYELLDGTNDPATADEDPGTPGEGTSGAPDEPTIEDLALDGRTEVGGTDGADVIAGTDAAERIATGDGADTITGSGADDQVLAGAGDDTVTGAGLIFGEAGDDTLTADAPGATLVGGEGNDVLAANASGATLFGGAGLDSLSLTSDAQAVGGEGLDVFTILGDADNDAVATIFDLEANENVLFDMADDERVGDVSITTATDADGNETGLDVVVTFTPFDDPNTDAPRIERLTLAGITDPAAIDGQLLVRLAGGGSIPLAVTNPLGGTENDDTLTGTDADDSFATDAGNDTVTGGGGFNTGDLGAGDDTYIGGGTVERVSGGSGDDSFTDVSPGADEEGQVIFNGDEGNDTFVGVRANIEMNGGAGDDTFTHGALGGTSNGGEGADTFNGGEGGDTFIMDESDTATGGNGADRFEISVTGGATETSSTITDYEPGTDLIQITIPSEDVVLTVVPSEDGTSSTIFADGDAVVVVQGGGALTVEGLVVLVAQP